MGARLRTWLDGPRPWRWAVVVALVVGLPALGLGLAADDHLLRANLTRDPRWAVFRTPVWDLFNFVAGASWAEVVDQGLGPWWSYPGMATHLFRPLSSLTHALDQALWPDAPWLMHLHSLLWYAALCGVAAALYRRLVDGWAAGLAALFFATDFTHGMTLAWVANRNALVAGLLGFTALLLHRRARTGGGRLAALLAPVALTAGLAAGETALGAAAYLLAYGLVLERGGLAGRLRTLWPYALALTLWVAGYRLGGYGSRGSGLYLDPVQDPLGFLAALPGRLLLELACELGGVGPDLYLLLSPAARLALIGAAALVVALAGAATAPLLRRDPTARFFALGAALATVPLCATFPSSRLMLIPGFGLVGLAARAFAAWRDRAAGRSAEASRWWPDRGPRRAAALVFAVAAGARLVVGVPLLLFMERQATVVEERVAELAATLPDDPALTGQRLVIVNPPDPLLTLYLLPRLSTTGRAVPARSLGLALGTRALALTRTDVHTVVVEAAEGLYGGGFSELVRPPDQPLPAGAHLEGTDFTVDVRAASGPAPTVVAFRFALPLEDPRLCWVAWDGEGLVPFALPAIGERVELPARPHPMWRAFSR